MVREKSLEQFVLCGRSVNNCLGDLEFKVLQVPEVVLHLYYNVH